MVESYIAFTLQPIMATSTSWLRICRDGAVALSNVHRGGGFALGGSIAANELQLGRRMSSSGVARCSNFAPGGALQGKGTAEGRALSLKSSLATVRQPSLSLRRVKTGNKLENDREEAVSIPKEEEKEKSTYRKEGLVEIIEAELGRQFGGALWFSVLLFCLALFGGVYVFLIVKYADFSDIPIFRGPQR